MNHLCVDIYYLQFTIQVVFIMYIPLLGFVYSKLKRLEFEMTKFKLHIRPSHSFPQLLQIQLSINSYKHQQEITISYKHKLLNTRCIE